MQERTCPLPAAKLKDLLCQETDPFPKEREREKKSKTEERHHVIECGRVQKSVVSAAPCSRTVGEVGITAIESYSCKPR